MGDLHLQEISNARRELEELYLGVPDESVNLTFQDFAQVKKVDDHNVNNVSLTICCRKEKEVNSPLTKLPSLDFNRALKSAAHNHNPRRSDYHVKMDNHNHNHNHHRYHDKYGSPFNSMIYGDVSGFNSEINGSHRGRRRRPGIPHSNICTVCTNYIYLFRHRCLVCGRVYCRQCVRVGMGDMAEGRKCIQCLGKRFSQRYIERAGEVGCCMGYPSRVKQEELKWAEKGPRRTAGDADRYNSRSSIPAGVMSRSTTPNNPTTTINNHNPTNSNSFVMMNSPHYSPYYSPTNHPLPF